MYVCIYYIGIEHVAGDMFEKVPTGDAIFLKVGEESIYIIPINFNVANSLIHGLMSFYSC